jgi:hypothetical protein
MVPWIRTQFVESETFGQCAYPWLFDSRQHPTDSAYDRAVHGTKYPSLPAIPVVHPFPARPQVYG